ncbi:cryptococcal mannosyltransferase 1-domain-containing protein [Podospora aff. communis PSN243]|uniref:Cryptococcal mannosyltransferase 1-domain-containing protein n=1 Tax=Podospora aff. communis PSN243 TaxID=3040156 RepID=A0AAV9GX45_9PEZI|nr:cryptococcal mannosyltransferase 1-domain-containing protein [Podospora aff. communis PSN243]
MASVAALPKAQHSSIRLSKPSNDNLIAADWEIISTYQTNRSMNSGPSPPAQDSDRLQLDSEVLGSNAKCKRERATLKGGIFVSPSWGPYRKPLTRLLLPRMRTNQGPYQPVGAGAYPNVHEQRRPPAPHRPDHLKIVKGRKMSTCKMGNFPSPFHKPWMPPPRYFCHVLDRIKRATKQNATLPRDVRDAYVESIMDPMVTSLPRLECPQTDLARYEYLKEYGKETDPRAIQYYFALDLKQALHLLPRLLGSVVEAIHFLGPERCLLSIVEGNSDDGTPEVLDALWDPLLKLNATYRIAHTPVNPLAHPSGRIPALAALRQIALSYIEPDRPHVFPTTSTTSILFLNDVAICPDDILELLHQRIALNAVMTCAMDWTYTQALYIERKPFQVFSCWNGAVAIAAGPVVKGEVKFRGPREGDGECMQGEPQLFCKDLWWKGYGRIAVVPGVSLEYSDERGRQIKKAKGYTNQWRVDAAIEWRSEPPEKVKCMPSYENQHWETWNKSQPGVG